MMNITSVRSSIIIIIIIIEKFVLHPSMLVDEGNFIRIDSSVWMLWML
jgi:hypothetical protein